MRDFARSAAIAILAALCVFPLVFAVAMATGITHDEHQHVAAGALLARQGLLPYRDFPYFHTPLLVFVYAGLFCWSDHLLIAARAFSVGCAALTAGAIFATAWHCFRAWSRPARWIGSIGALALLITTPVFLVGAPNAWNQQPSVLFALLATLLVLWACTRPTGWPAFFGAGLCLGLAVGFRLTFAPLALPLLGIIFFALQPASRSRLWLMAAFSGGATLALLPLWWLSCIAPEQTFFANFEFPGINLLYRLAAGNPRMLTLGKKLRYLLNGATRSNWILAVGFAVALGWYLRFSFRTAERFSLCALAALCPFLLLGVMAPTPIVIQYFYALIPFVLVAMILALRPLSDAGQAARPAGAILLGTVLLSIGFAVPEYGSDLRHLHQPEKWTTLRRWKAVQALRPLASRGPVLTFGPIDSLEAGLEIYPAFSTGPFAFRVAPFIEKSQRQRLGIVALSDLNDYLDRHPPGAILLGYERSLEPPLKAAATDRGFSKTSIGSMEHVWLKPTDQPSE